MCQEHLGIYLKMFSVCPLLDIHLESYHEEAQRGINSKAAWRGLKNSKFIINNVARIKHAHCQWYNKPYAIYAIIDETPAETQHT